MEKACISFGPKVTDCGAKVHGAPGRGSLSGRKCGRTIRWVGVHGSVQLALTRLLRARPQVFLCTSLDAGQPQRDGSQHKMAAAKHVTAAASSPIITPTQVSDAHAAAAQSGELVELSCERAMSLLLLAAQWSLQRTV